jgi:two-component system, NtrC family, sensor kinase
VVPIVVGIMVPDEPVAPLSAGAAGLAALVVLVPPGSPATHYAFLAVANGSCTFYGWVSAVLYRGMRQRERAAADARERALAELHRSEDRRALSERLASLGRLAAGVAHEMNNPLAFVGTNLAFVEAELRARGGDQECLEALAESRGGLERMKRIVQELGGFARGRADWPGPVDVLAAVEEARRTLAVRLERVASLVVRAGPELPAALASRPELVQVLVNLLANAVDAVEQLGGGPGRVEIEVAASEGALVLAVADNGGGLSAEAQAHAFEPFFSTKGPGGTGLGLALSREFVERWGGRIEAANRPAGGARVTVTLRRADGLDGPGPGGEGPAGGLPAGRAAAAPA